MVEKNEIINDWGNYSMLKSGKIGGQVQIKCLSPKTSSIRPTVGQIFESGRTNAYFSKKKSLKRITHFILLNLFEHWNYLSFLFFNLPLGMQLVALNTGDPNYLKSLASECVVPF